MPSEQETRTVFSDSYQHALEENWCETYKLGAKGGQQIDCSGFVQKALATAFGHFNCGVGGGNFAACSEDQLKEIGAGTGHCLRGNAHDFQPGGSQGGQIKAGMVLALRSGVDRGWNAGRELGVDHIACVYEDQQTHQLMVAESTSSQSREKGTNGVQRTELNDWLGQHGRARETLYVVDPVEMVTREHNTGRPAPSTRPGVSSTPPADSAATSKTDFNDGAGVMSMFKMLMQLLTDAMNGDSNPPSPAVRPAADRVPATAPVMAH